MKNKKTISVSFFAVVAIMLITASLTLGTTKVSSYAAEEIYYGNSGTYTTATETFGYSYLQDNVVTIDNGSFPAYYNTNTTLTFFCGAVAGANIMGYYDRYYSNLVPNYATYNSFQRKYKDMNAAAAYVQPVIDDLFVRMGTNTIGQGCTLAQYQNGMSSYLSGKNLSVTFTSVMTGSALDMTKLYNAIQNGVPVSLCVSDYNFSSVSENNGTVTLSKHIYTGYHIAVVYGYRTVNYYNAANTLVAAKTYLYAASGLSGETGVYIVGNNGSIISADATQIS